MITTIELADRDKPRLLAALHLEAAIVGYSDIFPDDAPPPTIEEVTEQWSYWLGPDWDAGRRAFVAKQGPATVGVVLAGADPLDGSLGHLARLYVTPKRWGEGIGTALYDAAVGGLREVGFAEATLWVLERNTRARSWYERLGWIGTGERKPVWAPAGIDDLRYRLPL